MRQPPTLRTLLAALGLALAASGAVLAGPAHAQQAQTEEPRDVPSDEAAATSEELQSAEDGVPADASEIEGVPADASTSEGAPDAPVEPTDQVDGDDEAGTDASGNTSDDPAPAANPERGEEVVEGALADEGRLDVIGSPWQAGIDFQPPATEVARDTQALGDMVDWIIFAISIFVMGLLLWVIYRYNEKRNPTPARFTHNSPLEIAWTIVPIIILVFIGSFSLPVLFQQQEIPPEADIRVKVTGYQWFWNYEYPDEGIAFDSYMIGYGAPPMTEAPDDPIRLELQEAGFSEELYKLATATAMVLPTGATVVVTVTGGDVIHSWTVPAFGVKQDAVPGRLAQLWFNTEQEGIYFGQCSELCGKDHAFMPIQVRVVSPAEYQAWLATAREEFGA